MKADVEGEIRVKCFMPSCSGESDSVRVFSAASSPTLGDSLCCSQR